MANTTGKKFGGRERNTPNKTTSQTKEILQSIVSKELDGISDLLEQLDPKERIDAVIKLLAFVAPKQTKVELETEMQERFNPIIINLGAGINPDDEEPLKLAE